MHSQLYWYFDSQPGDKHLGGVFVWPEQLPGVGQCYQALSENGKER